MPTAPTPPCAKELLLPARKGVAGSSFIRYGSPYEPFNSSLAIGNYDLQKPLPTTTTNVGILVAVGLGLAALVLWLLVEVPRYRHYRARSPRAYRPAGPRSRMRKARCTRAQDREHHMRFGV